MDRGYSHTILKEKLLSENGRPRSCDKTTRTKKMYCLRDTILYFYPLVSTIKEAFMKKWNLIQNQIFKEPAINSLRKENYGKGHAC